MYMYICIYVYVYMYIRREGRRTGGAGAGARQRGIHPISLIYLIGTPNLTQSPNPSNIFDRYLDRCTKIFQDFPRVGSEKNGIF